MECKLCAVNVTSAATQIFSIATIFIIIVVCHLVKALKLLYANPGDASVAAHIVYILHVDFSLEVAAFETDAHTVRAIQHTATIISDHNIIDTALRMPGMTIIMAGRSSISSMT